MSAHEGSRFDGLILFSMNSFWLSHAADVNFVSREAQKLPKLVNRRMPTARIPIITVARQRDPASSWVSTSRSRETGFRGRAELLGRSVRYHPAANSNLPAIAKERPKPMMTRHAPNRSGASQTARFREEVMSVLLTRTSKREDYLIRSARRWWRPGGGVFLAAASARRSRSWCNSRSSGRR